ncbi:hypothetical protein [Lactococcus lactis]|uniref:hypothetical protein n=1 Tax=Lactococcus lactis TaxID=1358 RepID=UPI0028928175|nr:hypothetical protein [Lactococcus lactis]MDT2886386.1 hypothetical protein [Lactococcus lactis]MDT2928849.1 hypothetical protein [Lactococcus lactis]
MTEIEKVTNNQAKARSIYNSLIKDNIFYTGISKNLAIALIELGIDSSTTDKLSVEKLQEHLLPYKKEMVQKIRDEKMQLVTADEFVKLHKESLTAIRENDKLQEQLNTAKYFFKNILDVNPNLHGGNSVMHLKNCVRVMKISAEKALAAIGNEGSGDE